MRYDPESNIVSLGIAAGTIDHVIELGNFLIHVNKNKTPLLVEILDGGKLISQFSGDKKKLMELTVAADS
ncbi:hypothetical protein A3G56_01930 [Candidatus Falkowbacteria bacterium RIFCSPLOWO2_12_FULL_45_10]|uniref:DUF2283 domain-containing protein n=3 Tax=Candidatus Falkowiibacteriota TaxID=1752728 RepID=A0A1F5RY25_9BACT|nr:MAG: hypothetical protein A3G56_01930 [Candidatus Falkowbacteria bacterium RIFCSPLOWO2_12_FULL_45_10]OGF18934.1 MAG: hypothetical protein A3I35_00230 [Candidatus Falkowbacteria bacterium RIFCSPLOWO2_02_FULL_45_15]OGF19143.1 MAG: hypothetical protein A3D54_03040 [Candidatus Falkowbacteria bacterium RIFCSPHIGHO2_02_FULL_45_15]